MSDEENITLAKPKRYFCILRMPPSNVGEIITIGMPENSEILGIHYELSRMTILTTGVGHVERKFMFVDDYAVIEYEFFQFIQSVHFSNSAIHLIEITHPAQANWSFEGLDPTKIVLCASDSKSGSTK